MSMAELVEPAKLYESPFRRHKTRVVEVGGVPVGGDHPIVVQGLQGLFRRQRDIDLVASCHSVDTALGLIRQLAPDVVVLDLRMPGASGLDLLRRVAAEKLQCRTVLLTAAISVDEVRAAITLGVSGLVMKDSPSDDLVRCVRRIHEGGQWMDQGTMTRAFREVVTAGAQGRDSEALTTREVELIRMVAEGLRNKEIGARLSIAEGTVKMHLHNIYEKLGVDGRFALLRVVRERALI